MCCGTVDSPKNGGKQRIRGLKSNINSQLLLQQVVYKMSPLLIINLIFHLNLNPYSILKGQKTDNPTRLGRGTGKSKIQTGRIRQTDSLRSGWLESCRQLTAESEGKTGVYRSCRIKMLITWKSAGGRRAESQQKYL